MDHPSGQHILLKNQCFKSAGVPQFILVGGSQHTSDQKKAFYLSGHLPNTVYELHKERRTLRVDMIPVSMSNTLKYTMKVGPVITFHVMEANYWDAIQGGHTDKIMSLGM